MTIATYSELVTEIGEWANRADTDFTNRIPTFIRLFEARVNRKLRSPQQEITLTQSTVGSTSTYALPSDFRQARKVILETDPITSLEPMSPANLNTFYPDSATGQPAAYAISGQNLILAPTPDGAYTLVINYFREVPALTDSNNTNWLLSAHPDAYLFGALCEAAAFLIDDDRAATWKNAWDEVLFEIMSEANDMRTTAGPLTLRPTVIE